MKLAKLFIVAVLLQSALSFANSLFDLLPITTASNVDIKRYMGTWYGIAEIPQENTRNCICTRADYQLQSAAPTEGPVVRVMNECREENPKGALKTASGVAVVSPQDNGANSKLDITFAPEIKSSYWILDLDPVGYEWSVVTNDGGTFFWVLARESGFGTEGTDGSQISAKLQELLNRASRYLDTSKVRLVNQKDCW